MNEDLGRFQQIIRRVHGCDSTFAESVAVEVALPDASLWKGEVAVFYLSNHPLAKRCYAWSWKNAEPIEDSVAVLEIPPVVSPETAVRATWTNSRALNLVRRWRRFPFGRGGGLQFALIGLSRLGLLGLNLQQVPLHFLPKLLHGGAKRVGVHFSALVVLRHGLDIRFSTPP